MHVTDEQYWPLFAYCEAEAIPILAHSGPSQDGAPYGEPDSYRPLLTAFPGLPIWLAHLGGANWEQAVPLASDHPSVHFDLCEIIEWVGASRAPTVQQLSSVVRAIGPDRIMMGSDFPWYDIASAIRRVNDLPSINDDEKARVLGGTAAQFLGLTSAA
jgi:predicted TIM-barrel fold metal-dependent hydrolase